MFVPLKKDAHAARWPLSKDETEGIMVEVQRDIGRGSAARAGRTTGTHEVPSGETTLASLMRGEGKTNLLAVMTAGHQTTAQEIETAADAFEYFL